MCYWPITLEMVCLTLRIILSMFNSEKCFFNELNGTFYPYLCLFYTNYVLFKSKFHLEEAFSSINTYRCVYVYSTNLESIVHELMIQILCVRVFCFKYVPCREWLVKQPI